MRNDNLMKRIHARSSASSIKKVQSPLLAKGIKGLKSLKPSKEPLLTKSMKAKHLAFAKAHQHWTTEQSSKAMFSDESNIQQFAARKQKVCRPKGRSYNEKDTMSTNKHRPSQMIWWAMLCNG